MIGPLIVNLLFRGVSGDRLSRLAGHVAMQQTYYPLSGGAVPLDAALWAAHAQLPAAPHVLVLPSTFRYFVKVSSKCVRLCAYVSIVQT